MVLETPIPNFLDWIVDGLLIYLPMFLAFFAVAGFLIGYLVSAARHGPVEGFYAVAQVIRSGVDDLASTSLRRTLAMAMLGLQEAIRRKVLIAFAVFVVVLLLAGWYLDVKSDDPARLYLSFVLAASNYLVLLLALFLSTFSLPADIKSRTIYTVVTKPVRGSEIVLGRILGFVTVGTAILVAMCVISYVFVVRGLAHRHQLEGPLQPAAADAAVAGQMVGQTTYDAHHRHDVTVAEGTAGTSAEMGHVHVVTGQGERYQVGPARDMLVARVVRRGQLRFHDRQGMPADSGINVGHEWNYRSYIEGGTAAKAIWTFDGITAARYPDGLDLELNLRIFRTHKGDIETGVVGSLRLQNPATGATSEPFPFEAKEFVIDRKFIPRALKRLDENGVSHEVDLFEDLTEDGKIEVVIQCTDPGQYYGMASPDVYILEDSGSFLVNFVKAYVGIWLQMLLVTTFGVMFSTFLSGPVAMLATLSTVVVGLFRSFIVDLAAGVLHGGGPIEALIRTLTQANLMVDLEFHRYLLTVIEVVDMVFLQMLYLLAIALPNYPGFAMTDFVASGFNIEPTLLGINVFTALAYFVIVSLIGYFFLKTREMAA